MFHLDLRFPKANEAVVDPLIVGHDSIHEKSTSLVPYYVKMAESLHFNKK